MLHGWAATRARTLGWLRTLTPEQRAHASVHPSHGRVTLDEQVVGWVCHDRDHLRTPKLS